MERHSEREALQMTQIRREEKREERTCTDIAKSLGGWPNCATPDCENKACLSLNSPYCYPCTRLRGGLTWEQVQTEIEENRRWSRK